MPGSGDVRYLVAQTVTALDGNKFGPVPALFVALTVHV